MNRSRASILGGLVVGLFVAAGGCAASSSVDDEAAQTAARSDGLTVVEADEAAGKLVAIYRSGGREITFDLRLGPPMETPPVEADPELPSMQIDGRVLDGAGQPFYLQMGGDLFLDPSWHMPKVENVDAAGRLQDVALAREAEAAFRSLSVPASLDELRKGAIQIARSMEHVADKPDVVVPNVPGEGGDVLAPKGVNLYGGTSSTAYWDYQIWKKGVTISLGLADHSAVRLRGWNSSKSFLFAAVSCNHGACAGASSMSVKCTMSGYRSDDGTHTRWFYSDTSTSTSTRSGGCQTTYMWNSGPSGHNCNDDSDIQINAIYYDKSQSTTSGVCAAAGARYWAPSCH